MKLDRDRLIRAREILGYGLEKTAEEAGISKNSVLRAEHEEDIRPSTARKIAAALGVEVVDLVEEEITAPPKAPAPSSPEAPEEARDEERRLHYLQAWRAFVWRLEDRWTQDPPTTREVAVVLDTMQALIDEGVFDPPLEENAVFLADSERHEQFERKTLFKGIGALNRIADDIEADEKAERRRATFREIKDRMAETA